MPLLVQVLLEIFGSPFMRSINVVVALLFGYFVAAVSRNSDSLTANEDGSVPDNFDQYVVSDKIDAGVCVYGRCWGLSCLLFLYRAQEECVFARRDKSADGTIMCCVFQSNSGHSRTGIFISPFPLPESEPANSSSTLLHPGFVRIHWGSVMRRLRHK